MSEVITTTEVMIELLTQEVECISNKLKLWKKGIAPKYEKPSLLKNCGKLPTIRLLEHFRKASFENTTESIDNFTRRKRMCQDAIIQLRTTMQGFDISVNPYKMTLIVGEETYSMDDDDDIYLVTRCARDYVYVITDNEFKYERMTNEVFSDTTLINSLEWLVTGYFK